MALDFSQLADFNQQDEQQGAPVTQANPSSEFSQLADFPTEKKDIPFHGGESGLGFVAGFMDTVNQLQTGILKAITPSGGAIEQGLDAQRNVFKQGGNLFEAIQPKATTAGNIAGGIAQSAPFMGSPASLLGKILMSGPVAGTILGAAQNPEDGNTRLENAMWGAAGGTIGSAIGGAVSQVGKHLPANKMAEFAKQGQLDDAAIQAAKDLDVPLSPIEASTSATLRSAPEKKIRMNPEKTAGLQAILGKREEGLQKTLADVKQSIVPSAASAKDEANTIYAELMPKEISKDVTEKIMPPEPIIDELGNITSKKPTFLQRLYQAAHANDSGLNFDDVQPGSFGDLYKTRQYINDKMKSLGTSIGTAERQGASSGKKGAAYLDLKKAKDELTEALKTVDPDKKLAKAESLVQKSAFISKLDQDIAKIPLKEAGQKNPTMNEIYKNIFGTEEKQSSFIKKVARYDGDAKKAEDLISVLKSLQKSPVEKLMKQNPHKSHVFSTQELGQMGVLGFAGGPVAAGSALAASAVKTKKINDYWYNQLFKDLPKGGKKAEQAGKLIKGLGLMEGVELTQD